MSQGPALLPENTSGLQTAPTAPTAPANTPSDAQRVPFAPDALIEVICAHRGALAWADLRHAGYPTRTIRAWLEAGMLWQDASGAYRLAEPEIYIDELILALWTLPEEAPVTIGGLTALEYHGYSVANVTWVDVALPTPFPPHDVAPTRAATEIVTEPGADAASDAEQLLPTPPLPLHPFHLPADLWAYGREAVTPGLPGTVAVPMYHPAVALAQILADPTMDLDSLTDATLRYTGYRGEDDALHAALRRYNVATRFRAIQDLNASTFT